MVGQRPVDHAEFDRLFAQVRHKVYAYAYKLTQHREDGKDIIQDACFLAYRSFAKYDRNRPFDSWFCAIIYRVFIDRWRSMHKYRISEVALEGADDEVGQPMEYNKPDPSPGPEEILMRGIVDEQLQRALDGVPENYRMALILVDAEGMSYAAVCTATGMPQGTIRSRIHRGRQLLREKYAALNGVNSYHYE